MQSIGHIQFDSGDLKPIKQDNVLGPLGTPASSSFTLDGREWKNPYHYYYVHVLKPMLPEGKANELATHPNWRTPVDEIAERLSSFPEDQRPFPLSVETHLKNVDVMERALVAMLEQNHIARRFLLSTKDAYLVYCPDERFRDQLWSYSVSKEDFSSSHSTFDDIHLTSEWKNSYGELLMCLRDVFKPTASEAEAERAAAMAAGAGAAAAGGSARARKPATPPASPRAASPRTQSRKPATPPASPRAASSAKAAARTSPAQGGDDDGDDDDFGPIGDGGAFDDDDDGGAGVAQAAVAVLPGAGAEDGSVAAMDAEYEAFLDSLVADAFSDSDDLPSDGDDYDDTQDFQAADEGDEDDGDEDELDDGEREAFVKAIQDILG